MQSATVNSKSKGKSTDRNYQILASLLKDFELAFNLSPQLSQDQIDELTKQFEAILKNSQNS